MSLNFVKLRVPGFHSWPAAPDGREYQRQRHRHVFSIEVMWDDKADSTAPSPEHHDLRKQVQHLLDSTWRWNEDGQEFDEATCANIAYTIGKELVKGYDRRFLVTVAEDNECGTIVECNR